MQVKSFAECSKAEHFAILLTFIKLPFVIKIVVLSTFGWPLKSGFTVASWSAPLLLTCNKVGLSGIEAQFSLYV